MSPATTLSTLEEWQRHKFRSSDVPLEDVASSLNSSMDEYILMKTPSKGRFALCHRKTKKAVHICFAFPWNWSTDLDTGNYVPKAYAAAEGNDDGSNLKKFKTPGPACAVLFSFDTSPESGAASAQTLLSIIDDLARSTCESFNMTGKPREKFQDTDLMPLVSNRVFMSSPLFEPANRSNTNSQGVYAVLYDLHPWIVRATSPHNKRWIPNTKKVKMSEVHEGDLRPLKDSDCPKMDPGDPCWVSFKIMYIEKAETWMTELIAIDVVRIAQGPLDSSGDDIAEEDSYEPLIPDIKSCDNSNVEDLVASGVADEDVGDMEIVNENDDQSLVPQTHAGGEGVNDWTSVNIGLEDIRRSSDDTLSQSSSDISHATTPNGFRQETNGKTRRSGKRK
ncbi:hypothetical protein DFP72DRAFT_1077888 [Ephemerocybe angulata]|uniref:Uncharacterized protein n=1 Tax=Ephemerocybe angulata TaxID=980116 RepID=A0A8H6HDJ6_9AGAR|nr:hypothetical protein DFP72DRAFT_1077888 [Tulosesus angulatus]